MPTSLSGFLQTNKVLLIGLTAAIATTIQQATQAGPLNYMVLLWAVLVAAIGFLANNLHGQVATILSSLLPTVGIIYESAKDNTVIAWPHLLALASVAILGAITGPAKAVGTKAILLFVVGTALATGCKAQYKFFQPMPKVNTIIGGKFYRAASFTDSSVTVLRPVAVAAAYGYESGGVSYVMAGTGFGLKHLQWDNSTGKWNSQYSFNAVAWAQGQVAPTGALNPFSFAFGPTVGFLNDVLQVGFAWDFTKGKPMAVLVFSIPTNN